MGCCFVDSLRGVWGGMDQDSLKNWCWCGVVDVQGLDELVIAIIMKEVLKALEYVHKGDAIHRDVKVCEMCLGLTRRCIVINPCNE